MSKHAVLALILILFLSACHISKNRKVDHEESVKRIINIDEIILPEGYKIEAIISELTFPSGLAFDDHGSLYVIESGYYNGIWTEPRLLKIENGNPVLIARAGKNGPWNGIVFYKGNFYVSEGGKQDGGKILKITPEGKITILIDKLPSYGDHQTSGIIIENEYIYFGQGSVTNSGIVGNDNYEKGWLKKKKNFHDIPCQDITVLGNNYVSKNIFTSDTTDKDSTGAFCAYGTSARAMQVIQGGLPCTGSVMKIPLIGGKLELVAWGFRNPRGFAADSSGKIYVTENAYEDRGSRPVKRANDVLWELKEGKWYGWPDFTAGVPLKEFKNSAEPDIQPLLQKYPTEPPIPVTLLGLNSGSNGLAISSKNIFGYNRNAFIAQNGKITTVNLSDHKIKEFAANSSSSNIGGIGELCDLKFNPSENALYVTDLGTRNSSGKMQQKTGVIWKISKK